jgi:hypothetical protein
MSAAQFRLHIAQTIWMTGGKYNGITVGGGGGGGQAAVTQLEAPWILVDADCIVSKLKLTRAAGSILRDPTVTKEGKRFLTFYVTLKYTPFPKQSIYTPRSYTFTKPFCNIKIR